MDDVLIIFDENRTSEKTFTNQANSTDKHFQFKISIEEKKLANYLKLSFHRNDNNINIGIYKKRTCNDTSTQFCSNHPYEQKIAPFNYYINRIIMLPITEQSKQKEWKIILEIATNKGFPTHIIQDLKK